MSPWTDLVDWIQNNPNAEKTLYAALGTLLVAFFFRILN